MKRSQTELLSSHDQIKIYDLHEYKMSKQKVINFSYSREK